MRTGKSTRQSIVRMLASGTRVELLELDSEAGYARVRTRGGTEGWVLSPLSAVRTTGPGYAA